MLVSVSASFSDAFSRTKARSCWEGSCPERNDASIPSSARSRHDSIVAVLTPNCLASVSTLFLPPISARTASIRSFALRRPGRPRRTSTSACSLRFCSKGISLREGRFRRARLSTVYPGPGQFSYSGNTTVYPVSARLKYSSAETIFLPNTVPHSSGSRSLS